MVIASFPCIFPRRHCLTLLLSPQGLRDGGDQDGVLLGRYVYRESGPPLQVFPAHPPAGSAFSVVELRVHDNWGHRDYTCLYRFRVHGRPVDVGESGGEVNDGR